MPRFASAPAASISAFRSVTVTRAPRRASSSAAATPLLAAPTTTTRRPATENIASAQLQRRQTQQREDDSHDHKSGDHLRLAPTGQLEVVMKRRHLEHALPRQAERRDLDNHGQRLGDEHASDDEEQQFLLDE